MGASIGWAILSLLGILIVVIELKDYRLFKQFNKNIVPHICQDDYSFLNSAFKVIVPIINITLGLSYMLLFLMYLSKSEVGLAGIFLLVSILLINSMWFHGKIVSILEENNSSINKIRKMLDNGQIYEASESRGVGNLQAKEKVLGNIYQRSQ